MQPSDQMNYDNKMSYNLKVFICNGSFQQCQDKLHFYNITHNTLIYSESWEVDWYIYTDFVITLVFKEFEGKNILPVIQ